METLPPTLNDRILGLEYVPPDQLTAHPDNFRRHPVAQRRALRASLERFGWAAAVLVTRDGTVVDGHARVEEALSAGLETIPVLRLDLSEEEAGSLILRLDPIAAMAETDSDILGELLADEEWIEGEDGLVELLENKDDRKEAVEYIRKIDTPVYEVSGPCPPVETLVDTAKRDSLIANISDAEIPAEVKAFLQVAAERHVEFRYDRIAEYYAHADEQVQALMEESALVIIRTNPSPGGLQRVQPEDSPRRSQEGD